MITRIVKMTFRPEACEDFLLIFNESKKLIRGFEGCSELKLLRAGNIFFTYSTWADEQHLNNYRHSELFENTWRRTKALFADKPEAWTTTLLHEL